MPRFYCSEPLAVGATIALPEAVAHHVHVVRLQPGDELCLFDGSGGQYRALLASAGKRQATATVVSHDPREVELPYQVTLAQALPEGTKMDWIIEKAVELGVSAIQPRPTPTTRAAAQAVPVLRYSAIFRPRKT